MTRVSISCRSCPFAGRADCIPAPEFQPRDLPHLWPVIEGPNQYGHVRSSGQEHQAISLVLSGSQRLDHTQPALRSSCVQDASGRDSRRCMHLERGVPAEDEFHNLGSTITQRQAASERNSSEKLLDLLEAGLKSHDFSASKSAKGRSNPQFEEEFSATKGHLKVLQGSEISADGLHKVMDVELSDLDGQHRRGPSEDCGHPIECLEEKLYSNYSTQPTSKRKQGSWNVRMGLVQNHHSMKKDNGVKNLQEKVKQAAAPLQGEKPQDVNLSVSGIASSASEHKSKASEGKMKGAEHEDGGMQG